MKSNIPTATFTVVWQACRSVQEAAHILEMTPKAAGARASNLRAKGVKLKQLKRTPPPNGASVERLNELILRAR